MKLFLGADHRGFELKETMKAWLLAKGYDVSDCGNTVYDKDDDFTDYAFGVADQVVKRPDNRGIMFCSTGTGMMIAANKVIGVRCGASINIEEVIHSRKHHNLNMISIAADFTTPENTKDLIGVFLTTPFLAEERFVRRLGKIQEKEEQLSSRIRIT